MSKAFFVVERPRVGMLQSLGIRLGGGGREGVKKSVGVGDCVDRCPSIYTATHTSCLLERESTGTHNHRDVRF